MHQVRICSSCLSPLGLCLIQFGLPVARNTMISLSPHQLDAVREILVEEHDRGRNLHACPFTRTCWIMFLGFPLDFQTLDIISQVLGLFGTIATWTGNSRCRSRVLLRCRITQVNRVPRSLIIAEGNPIGGMVTLGLSMSSFLTAITMMVHLLMKISSPQWEPSSCKCSLHEQSPECARGF